MKKYNIVNNTLGWLCFAIAAVTYLLTIEPTASFWDCPEFISQGAKLEVGHPPGNPIFMLAARFFVTIFGGDIANAAVAVNSMSALLSAATILLLFWTITHLVKKIVVKDDAEEVSLAKMLIIMGSGLCGALAYTWSDTFWFSAVEGEVYAFSSFCTALVFWLILKWENRADLPHSDRYLVLIAYVIGVSIAVHLLNLLCIPAIVLVFYYRKWKNVNTKGSLIALALSFVIVAAILYGLVPGFIKVAQGFELLFVNSFGCGYNTGVLVYAAVMVALFVWAIITMQKGNNATLIKVQMWLVAMLSGLTFATDNGLVWLVLAVGAGVYLFFFCPKVPQRIFNVLLLSVFVIFVGYSSYALLLIRASANTPMNQNAPDNVFSLSSYLNREQYGQRPLMYGTAFADTYEVVQDGEGRPMIKMDETGLPVLRSITMSDALYYKQEAGGYRPIVDYEQRYTKVAKSDPREPDKYIDALKVPDYKTSPDLNMLLPRVYSLDPTHSAGYKVWSGYVNEDLQNMRQMVPLEKRRAWAAQRYVPLYEVAPYMQHIEYVSLFDNAPAMQKLPVWKASMLDNLRYFLNYQLNHMYWRYFMWNFAGRQNDIQGNGEPQFGNWISGIPAWDNARLGDQSLMPARYTTENKGHNVFYMLPLLMGLFGLLWQALAYHPVHPRRGIEQFWVVFFLFFMTGIAIVLYLNQTTGQPRERDYAFAGSFYAYAIWVGMGVAAIAWALNTLFRKVKGLDNKKPVASEEEIAAEKAAGNSIMIGAASVALVVGLIVPLQMVSQTWDDHDRSHRYTTRDFGENYLNSLDKDAILFTNGDNDTFPLWYAQEVEGVRTDVRVVNLSYLTTDWYANQMRHPYYDAKAIDFTAKPTDYAYEALGYSRVAEAPDNNRVTVKEGLTQFLKDPSEGLRTPYMYVPVDSVAAIARFGVDMSTSDSVLVAPYANDLAMDGLSHGGFSLSNLLSFDIVANSAANNFDRPVYFAMTVPNTYYLDLDPYMYSTGMAAEVTPFYDADASPRALKAYENIIGKFRWGGLDDPEYGKGLYLDETVRRMVSTTRSTMVQNAEDLLVSPAEPASEFAVNYAKEHGTEVPATRADMARIMLQTITDKLPADVSPMESMVDIQMAAAYLKLYNASGNEADLAAAKRLIGEALPFYASLANYAVSLPAGWTIGRSDDRLLQYAPSLLVLDNYITALAAAKEKGVEIPAELKAAAARAVEFENSVYIGQYLYGSDNTSEDYYMAARQLQGINALVAKLTGAIAELDELAGIDRAAHAGALMKQAGSSLDTLLLSIQ